MKHFLLSRPVGNGIRGILLLAMLLMSFGYGGTKVAYAAPPAHDDFNSAKTINNIEYHDLNINTTEATPSNTVANVDDPDNIPCPEPGNPDRVLDYGLATVWYKYTPPEDQAISINTLNSTYDTFLAVWTGSRGNLTLVNGTCNDDTFEGQQSETGFIGQGGITYYIEVAQFNPGTGTPDIGGTLNFNAYITNTQVRVKNSVKGSYYVQETSSLRRNLLSLNAGPMEVRNIAQNQTVVSERFLYNVQGVNTSFSEMMGMPNNQLYKVYRLPWYNNKTMATQLRIANVSSTTAQVTVRIGGLLMGAGAFNVPAKTTVFKDYPGVNRGPVKIVSNVNILVSERVLYKVNTIPTSYSELMGFPENRLNKVFWLPWYNNKGMTTQLQISNANTTTAATIKVFIGGQLMGSPFTLGAGQTVFKTYPGIDKGPVKIVSNVNIMASERFIYRVNNVPVSFTEMIGLPSSQLDTTYWMPMYTKNTAIVSHLQIANASTSPARVHVYINGIERIGSPFNLAVGGSKRIGFGVVEKGPVKIVSTVKIIAGVRVIYLVRGTPTSYSEMMALPNRLMDSKYWLPWYNNKTMNTQLRFALP